MGVTCCNSATSSAGSRPGCKKSVTYDQANAHCAASGGAIPAADRDEFFRQLQREALRHVDEVVEEVEAASTRGRSANPGFMRNKSFWPWPTS